MKNKKNKIIFISVSILVLFSSIAFYLSYNKSNINNLVFTTGELQLYDYDENAMNDDGEINEEGIFVSAANDLKDYYNGYQIKLSELEPLEKHFGLDIVYFLVNYSTTDKEALISIGVKSKEEISEQTIKSFTKWLEENEKAYIGKNDLNYKSVTIEVMKDFEQELKAGDYYNSYLRHETYLTDENVFQQIFSEKNGEIMSSTIHRISQIKKSELEKENYEDIFDYELKDAILNDLKDELILYLLVDKKQFSQLNTDELIKFAVQFEALNKRINQSEDLSVDINLVDKENEGNSLLFSSTNGRLFVKNKFIH